MSRNLNARFFYFFYRYIFKFSFLIYLVSYLRFLYFFYIKKSFKTLYEPSSDDGDMGHRIKDGKKETALTSNLDHASSPLSDFLNSYGKFTSKRTEIHIGPLKSLDYLVFKKMKVLIVGPRVESEIFRLLGYGFSLKNIKSIDIQSYSNLITLANMIEIPFEDNSFDLIIVGWVITYSNAVQKAADEFIRVGKNNCLISLCHTHKKKEEERLSDNPLSNSSEILNYFKKNLSSVIFKYHPFDKTNNTFSKRSNLLIEIFK